MNSGSPFSPALRILHLEDNLADAELIHAQIERQWPDLKVTLVDTRDGFLQALDSEEFDLILSDFTMPNFNGLKALELVRARGKATPFMFISGTIGEENAVAALQRGAADYLIKDRPARLIPAMRAALEQRREHQLRQLAEQRLREQGEALDKAGDAICIADLEGRVTYWNQSASRLFGWDAAKDCDRLLKEVFGLFNQALVPDALQEIHRHGAWTKEMQLPGTDDNLHHIVSRWTLVRDNAGQPKSILIINTDVTEQKKLETRLLRAQRLESVGMLAGGIAHDLNNVLAPILMAVNLLQQKLTDVGMLRIVGVLETSAQRGAALIRQVLAFSRGMDGERTALQPRLVIKEVVLLLGETLPRAIRIETELSADLWLVKSNTTQLSQVLMNLGVNARDAMPNGGQLLIKAANCPVDDNLAQANPGAQTGPHVLITVTDTGTGIPPELLHRIFDPFFTTKAAGKGTGLGLSTVLGIVKSHGGFMQVQSELGRGTEVRIYLPATVSQAESPTSPADEPPVRGHGEIVLVIDDESAVREITGTLLEEHGYHVLLAENGSEGLAQFRQHQAEVSVVITDMMMPGMQGAEVIQELRLLKPGVGIVAMSGVLREGSKLTEESDRLIILRKPMTAQDLMRALLRLLPCTSRPPVCGHERLVAEP
jgi:PAS domain S-box-containing protein